jgi:hypothetical protein
MSLSSARSKEPGIGPKTKKPRSMAGLIKGHKKPDSMVGLLKGVSLRSQQHTLL